ncbi:MAG: tyrosine-type recombinase/integrase, partial [Nitrososphaeria archaeon]|nr:tyrosine-type recombinase/integrase [Nitrososphaeria archaeon]
MASVGGIFGDRLVSEYLEIQPESFRRHRRHYVLVRVLEVFLRHSGFGSVEEAVKAFSENPRNGLAAALQRTVNELVSMGLRPKSVLFSLHLLKKFLEFYDVPVENVWRKVRKPRKTASRVDRIPSLAEIQKLVLASRSPRMRLLIQLLCQTGLRISEALNLRVDCIDLEKGVIRVPGEITKTGVGREVPIVSELKEALMNYLRGRKTDSPYLFPSLEDPSRPWPIARVRTAYRELLRRMNMA